MAAVQDLVLTFCSTMRRVQQRKLEQDDMCLECTAILAVSLSYQQDDKKIEIETNSLHDVGELFPRNVENSPGAIGSS